MRSNCPHFYINFWSLLSLTNIRALQPDCPPGCGLAPLGPTCSGALALPVEKGCRTLMVTVLVISCRNVTLTNPPLVLYISSINSSEMAEGVALARWHWLLSLRWNIFGFFSGVLFITLYQGCQFPKSMASQASASQIFSFGKQAGCFVPALGMTSCAEMIITFPIWYLRASPVSV